MYSDTSSAPALSGPVRSEVQEELLAHVSGGLVNRVVISPPLFRLSLAFSSKSHSSQEGPALLYLIGQETREWFLLGLSRSQSPLYHHPSHPPPSKLHAHTQRIATRRPKYKCCPLLNGVWNRIHLRLSSSILFIPNWEWTYLKLNSPYLQILYVSFEHTRKDARKYGLLCKDDTQKHASV